ncbi:Translation initiation factor 3 subunit b [Mycoemilia scoparia]|uniref:Eukaryotic translation initiation factor 3 subunit B n=1 Tax=Mycoemilia scoparia TaxID=417184 RepID=A0A9W8A6M9_9FUNG|nr:Translation initiation factor 3 subunit b [Mycoemilia scoparia]
MVALDPRNLPATVDDIDFSDLEKQFQVDGVGDTFDNFVVIDNLPVVDEVKKPRLIKLLDKKFSPMGKIKPDGIEMPMDTSLAKPKSKGFAFVEFETPEGAREAIQKMNNHPLDKSHVLAVNAFMDIEKYLGTNETYEEPVVEEFKEKEHLKSWLSDPRARDQFFVITGANLKVLWNEKTEEPSIDVDRNNWTETYSSWSPKGSFLLTTHRPGIGLWGGKSWEKQRRFVHPGVFHSSFSPNEKFLVTWSPEPINYKQVIASLGPEGRSENQFTEYDNGHQLCIWDTFTGALLRSFPTYREGTKEPLTKFPGQIFKWSPSSKYFASITPGQSLSIYESATMTLLDKKSIKVPGIKDFSWSSAIAVDERSGKEVPEMIAYWTPESGNLPARVTILSVPSKEIIRTKNLFSVDNCRFAWHPSGKYLCVTVQRHSKNKKQLFSNLEIFRVSEKDIPVDVVEMKDSAVSFAWEPTDKGPRFAVLHTDNPTPPQLNNSGMALTTVRTNVSFYKFEKSQAGGVIKTQYTLVKTLAEKNTTELSWSPRGRHIILGTLRTTQAWDLEFYDTEWDPTEGQAQKGIADAERIYQVAANEHYGVTDLEWDPTGRYVLTSASSWRHTIENGYILWDFKGECLYRSRDDKFRAICWRPRPKSLLSDEQKRVIRKNLKKYSKIFDEEDRRSALAITSEMFAQRRRVLDEWNAWRKKVDALLEKEKELADKSGYRFASLDDQEILIVEEIVETVIEEKEEEVKE